VALKAQGPNQVWSVDFIHDSCLNGQKLKILSVADEFTRECLALEVGSRVDSARVRDALGPLLERRGAPIFVRSDNGGEFISRLLAVFLSKSGTGSRLITPGSPWENPFVETFHSTLRRDCLDVEVFVNLADARLKLTAYRQYYNEVRPHSSLGHLPPAAAAQAWKASLASPAFLSMPGVQPPLSNREI